MAQLLHSTRFKSPSTAATPFTVTIPATAAGAKLVCVAGGGATIQAKLGASGPSFTRRTNSLNSREVVAQDIVDAGGGSTVIEIVLNGAENVDGMIFEFAAGALGNFVAGANNNDPGGNSSTDPEGHAITGSVTTLGATVLFMMFTAGQNGTVGPADGFWGVQPLAKRFSPEEYIQMDPAKSKYHSLIAVSDQASAGTFQALTSRVANNLEHQSVLWAYQDLDTGNPTYANPYPNPIAAENSLPGSIFNTWFGATADPNIAGYTDSLSYTPGSTVNFRVDSGNIAFGVEIARFGFYGYHSFGGRRLANINGAPTVQPAPTVNAYGGKECAWTTTATWAIPSNATPGIYVYNMRRGDNAAFVAQGIFVVRPTTVPGTKQNNRIMVTTADFTWQAYNLWGATTNSGGSVAGYTGRSLYTGNSVSDQLNQRAFAVSYDRPNGSVAVVPQTYFWDSEAGLVNFLEANGYYVDYYTSADIEKDTTIPSKYGIAVSSGHSEYWTANLRDAYDNARDAGTHLLILSSNTALWHVRFDPADTNKRTMICYKDSHDTVGYDGSTKYDPVIFTGTWRDSRTNIGGVNNTARRPESSTTGLWFVGNGDYSAMISIPNSYRTLPIWRNTSLAAGVSISVRGTASHNNAAAAASIDLTQPVNAQLGDTIIVALTFNGNPSSFAYNGAQPIRRIDDGTSQTTIVMLMQVVVAGTQIYTWNWSNSIMASGVMTIYANAVWNDSDSSIAVDSGGTASHTTDSMIPASNDRWAVCVFADSDTGGSNKTTSWTAGAGITSRVSVNNAATGGPWHSVALMDSGGAVTQAAHQYSATAEFANSHAATFIMYLTPGINMRPRTLGFEWDYLKVEEPTTPVNLVRLSDQVAPLIQQAANYNGNSYGNTAVYRHSLIMYQAASGALVFNTGVWRYQNGLSRWRMNTVDLNGAIDVVAQQAIINVVRDMGISPPMLVGTISNVDPTPLVDPGAAATAADYGLTVTNPGYKSIFDVAVPVNPDNAQNTDYTLGTVFTASTSGKIHGIRWHFPGTLPNRQVVGLLYSWTTDATGTELARVTMVNAQTGWNEMLFSSPVNITANTKYVAAVWTFDRTVATINAFTSAVTNGNLTAIADTGSAHNGKLLNGVGSPAYPTGTASSASFFTDVLFEGSGTVSFEGWGIPL